MSNDAELSVGFDADNVILQIGHKGQKFQLRLSDAGALEIAANLTHATWKREDAKNAANPAD